MTFLDGLIQINILQQKLKSMKAQPYFIKKLTIDVEKHYKYVENTENKILNAFINIKDEYVRFVQ